MKNKIKLLFFALILIISIFTFNEVNAIDRIEYNPSNSSPSEAGKILVPVEIIWDESVSNIVGYPSEIELTIYKYLGDSFDMDDSNTEKIETVKLNVNSKTGQCDETSEVGVCKHTFDVSMHLLTDNITSSMTYNFKVIATPILGYYAIAQKDSTVTFIPPTMSEDGDRITEKNEIVITPTEEGYNAIVFVKKGNLDAVWSATPLSEAERRLVFSALQKINGFNNSNFNSVIFLHGFDTTFTIDGKTLVVEDTTIQFGKKSDWSMIAVGEYFQSSIESNSAWLQVGGNLIDYTVSKVWKDYNDIDMIRPTNVKVKLLADGVEIEGNEIILSSDNNWTYTFNNLPEYKNGKKIVYTVEEAIPDGYEANYDYSNNNKVVITNQHNVEFTSVKVIKNWENVAIFGDKLPSIILNLYYKIDESDTEWKLLDTVILKENGTTWEYTWTKVNNFGNLPESYVYKVEEEGFANIDDAEFIFNNFFDVSYNVNGNEVIITNQYNGTLELPETGSSSMLLIILLCGLFLGLPLLYMIYTFVRKYI